MIVSNLKISGFRGIDAGSIRLQKFSVLFGANNCGKTTIMEALALVLGRDRLIRQLTEHDFRGSNPSPTDRISIVATITDFEGNEVERNADWFRHGRAKIKWEAADGTLTSEKVHQTDKLACQIAFGARFDHESLDTLVVRYFYDADLDPFEEDAPIVSVPIDLIRQIGLFLVPASRTWDRTISFGSELFRRVVSYVGGKPAAAVLVERDRLRRPANPLEDDENISELVAAINSDIKQLFSQGTQLKLRITSTDSDGILDAILPHYSLPQGIALPARRQGSGLVSLQTLILLMRFGHLRVAKQEGFMMLIEEPELHVPPPLQRKLLRLMQTMTTQTIVTTHSPTVAAIPDPHQLSLITSDGGTLTARPLISKALGTDAPNHLRRLFMTDRESTVLALMHPNVLVPEGKIDSSWLRLFVKAIELSSSELDASALNFANEVGLVPTPDAHVSSVFANLSLVHTRVFCLVDGDDAGNGYIATCCGLPHPPSKIIRWPTAWTIENVVGWVVEADPTVLASPDLVAANIPGNPNALVAALLGQLKNHEIVHALIVDVLASNELCRARIRHVLKLMSDIAAGRTPEEGAAISTMHQNGQTTIWTFNNAFGGI